MHKVPLVYLSTAYLDDELATRLEETSSPSDIQILHPNCAEALGTLTTHCDPHKGQEECDPCAYISKVLCLYKLLDHSAPCLVTPISLPTLEIPLSLSITSKSIPSDIFPFSVPSLFTWQTLLSVLHEPGWIYQPFSWKSSLYEKKMLILF